MPDLQAKGPLGLNGLGASQLCERLAAGTATSVQIVTDCLARIQARDGEVRAWAHIDRDAALAQARARDAEPRRGPLHGIPVGIKDVLDTSDMPTAYGSPIHAGHRPANDSAVVGLLRAAGAVILGKCVTTEFASPVPAGTRNPHDLTSSPGVSSSGSAAAVADFHVPLAVGTQTGGSTILPASYCGVVGYKASLTALDRGGIRHLKPTLDTLGLFARSVDDIALMRAAILGHKPFPAAISLPAKPRIGLCRQPAWADATTASRTALETAAADLSKAGATIVEAELPAEFDGIAHTFRVISSTEGVRSLAGEIADHLPRLNDHIRSGHTLVQGLAPDAYDKAQVHAALCRRSLDRVFDRCDAIITPAATGEALPDAMASPDSAFNRIWTLMHTPALSLPLYDGPAGMPIGLQVVGPIGGDDRTIALAGWISEKLS